VKCKLQTVIRVGKKSFYTHFPLPTPVQCSQNTFTFSNIERGNGGADTYSVGIMVMPFHVFGMLQHNLSMTVAVKLQTL